MKWKKLGQLYVPRCNHPKLITHAANPLPIPLGGDRYRILFSGRDHLNRSSVGWVEVNIETLQVTDHCDQPLFECGPEGSFFAAGVSLGNLYAVNGRQYVPFMGWQTEPGEHWRGDVGLLELCDDGSLVLALDQPILAQSEVDRISLSYPWVEQSVAGSYSMFYGSTLTWNTGAGEMHHVINIADSNDGFEWHARGQTVPSQLGLAQAFSRPSVMSDRNGDEHMWFSYRAGAGDKYRIGYAFKSRGKTWDLRLGGAVLEPSSTGWDSEMTEYPFVFRHSNRVLMLYNGNSYGLTGFGLAELEDADHFFN